MINKTMIHLTLTLLLSLTACTKKDEKSVKKGDSTPPVEKVLKLQAEAWNAGDIDAFMEHYWKSDKLSFSSGGKTVRGWKATLERYKKRYPDKEAMGKLTFDQLEITRLGLRSALVLGRWQLERSKGPIGGNFSLIFRHMEGRWVIVHDHTSVLEKDKEEPKKDKAN